MLPNSFGNMLRWFLLLMLLVATALAGGAKEPYGLALVDELKQLDRVGLEQAAQPLLKRGAAVAVVLVRKGGQADAVKQLAQLGLLQGTQIAPTGVYLYVSLEPHYSELRAGARFRDDLPPAQLETIRDQSLNPQLRGERYQQGLVDSLGELERRLSHSLSLKDWLKWGTVTFMVAGMLYLCGFFEWFSDTPPGRALLWLWSLTPWARAAERKRLEEARQGQLWFLQSRLEALERLRKDRVVRKSPLDALVQQAKASADLDVSAIVELRSRVEAESRFLEQLERVQSAGQRELTAAQELFRQLRSALKSRKKTRPLLESPELQSIEAELKQESELRRRLDQSDTEIEEYERSEQRCRALHQRARELAVQHGVLKQAPTPTTVWTGTATPAQNTSGYTSPSNTYEDRSNNNYEPPSSSSESWAGGNW